MDVKNVSAGVKKMYSALFLLFLLTACKNTQEEQSQSELTKLEGNQLAYVLPSPLMDGNVSVEKALANRRSHRNFVDKAISAEQLSQVLWAAYGVSKPHPDSSNRRGGLRTAPSAGAVYPFEIYIVVGRVKDIEPGVYKYISQEHKIVRTINGDIRESLSAAALGQTHVKEAPVTILYAAVYSRMVQRYGDRGRDRYVCMDLGHSAQNVYLQVESLNMGTCAIGAFSDDKLAEVMQLPEEEVPLYIMPIGFYYRER